VLLHPGVSVDDVPSGQDYVSWDTKANASNISAWANTDYMELVNQGQTTYDEGEREDLYLEATKLAHEQAPWVYLDYAQTTRACTSR